MPNYDFLCKDCNHKFSLFVSIKDKDQVQCPACVSANVVQRFTGFMFTKSGSGSGSGMADNGGSGKSSCSGSNCSCCSGC